MAHSMEGQDLRSILRELPTISSNLEGLRFAKHFAGQSHSVYKVENDSGKCFILRVPKDALAAELTERGLKIAKHIKKKKPTIQIPEVFYQAPGYTVLEFLGGNPIGKWDKELSNEWRHQWLDGFAGFLAELWTCPILDDDSLITKSYKEWLIDEVDKAIHRALRDPSWGNITTFLCRRSKINELLPHRDNGWTAVRHGDLNAWNVLADVNKFSGVVDWDTAQVTPIPAAVQHPLFIAGIPGWRNDVPSSIDFSDDREYLENAVLELSKKLDINGLLAELLASSQERQFFQLSLRNKAVNNEYVRLRLNDEIDSAAIEKELSNFTKMHEDAAENAAIKELLLQLKLPRP